MYKWIHRTYRLCAYARLVSEHVVVSFSFSFFFLTWNTVSGVITGLGEQGRHSRGIIIFWEVNSSLFMSPVPNSFTLPSCYYSKYRYTTLGRAFLFGIKMLARSALDKFTINTGSGHVSLLWYRQTEPGQLVKAGRDHFRSVLTY